MLALAAAFVGPSVSVLAETVTTSKTTTVTEPTGRLVITDPGTRSFRVGTESRVYVAPPSIDLEPLSGRDVKVFLGDDGRVSRITRTTETMTTD
jgi:hypothetical protein